MGLPQVCPAAYATPTHAPQSRAECYVEKGMIYQKMRDYRRACRELQQAVKLDGSNAQASPGEREGQA